MPDWHTRREKHLNDTITALLKACAEERLPTEDELFDVLLTGSFVFAQGVALSNDKVRELLKERLEEARLDLAEKHDERE